MRLLVTGGLGFIGSNFILRKLNDIENLSITNVDAEFFGSNHENLSELKNSPNYKFVKGNITDKKLMETLISECDYVINFAAESHVDRSILDSTPFLISNVNGVLTILDIVKNQKKDFYKFLQMKYLVRYIQAAQQNIHDLIHLVHMLQQKLLQNY